MKVIKKKGRDILNTKTIYKFASKLIIKYGIRQVPHTINVTMILSIVLIKEVSLQLSLMPPKKKLSYIIPVYPPKHVKNIPTSANDLSSKMRKL